MPKEYPALPIVAVAAVVLRDGEVLLIKRGVEPAYGKWSIPGGVVDLGETLCDAAAREVKEETGLDVDIGPVVEIVERVLRDDQGRIRFHYVIVDYVAKLRKGPGNTDPSAEGRRHGDCEQGPGEPVGASDALEARWFPVAEVQNLDTTEWLVHVIQKAVASEM